jgi:hypothetical protein
VDHILEMEGAFISQIVLQEIALSKTTQPIPGGGRYFV